MSEIGEAAHEGAQKAGNLLSRRIGPLPAGAWLLAIVGGVGVAYYINRAGGPAAELDTSAADAASSDAEDFGNGGNTATPPGIGNHPPASGYPTPPAVVIKTNNQWRTAAIRNLIDNGRNGLSAAVAVGKYLRGRRLTDKQAQLVAEAIALTGPTPTPVKLAAPAPHKPKPKPHDPPKPKPHKPGGGNHGGGHVTPTKPIHTNAEWRGVAREVLLADGVAGDVIAESFADYFNSRPLSQRQRHVINRAIAKVGAPPNPPRAAGHASKADIPAPAMGGGRPAVPASSTRDTGGGA